MADDDYYDDYEPSCMEKFQEHFLYCFIPTLCIMFDVGFITVGVICLAKGGDSDFSTCDDAAGDHGRTVDAAALAERGYDENEVAAKMAGQPCLCQIVPGSGIGMLMLGVFLLLLSRIPPYLNRQHHQIKITESGEKWPLWCITCMWMRQYDEDDAITVCCGGGAADIPTGEAGSFSGAATANHSV